MFPLHLYLNLLMNVLYVKGSLCLLNNKLSLLRVLHEQINFSSDTWVSQCLTCNHSLSNYGAFLLIKLIEMF